MESIAKTTYLVTVTYGNRWHLLFQALESAFRAGLDHAIVVDNGASEPIKQRVAESFGEKASVVTLGKNTGSANGFKAGLQGALKAGADFILLLDDDNTLEIDALNVLKAGWFKLSPSLPWSHRVMLGFRPEHQADVAEGVAESRVNQHPNSFFGFRVRDIPFKLWRRTGLFQRAVQGKPLPKQIRMSVAPYSGMFFHRELLEIHGLPNEQLILYADDTEFSYRVTRAGGEIWLLTGARITDLESSWNVRKRFSSSFEGLLTGEGDRRAYYAVRNQAFFEMHCRSHNTLMRSVNRAVYLALLAYFARRSGKHGRHQLLLQAIADGEHAQLGENPAYPLQSGI